jgi:phage FluMu gp28-like protein
MHKDWSAAEELDWVAEVRSYYGDAANEELDVIPSQGSGAWLSTALIEARMDDAPVLRNTAPVGFERLPDAARHAEIQEWLEFTVAPVMDALQSARETAFGMDFARSGDLSVIGFCEIDQKMQRRCPAIIELRNMPHRQQEQIVNYVLDRLPRLRKGAFDARGNGHALAEFAAQKYGWHRIELVMPTETWYREQMPPLKAAFEDDTIRIPRDMDIRNDLRAVKVVRGVARVPEQRTAGSDGGKRHGDAAIALALMYYASRAETVEIEYTLAPAPPRGIDRAPDAGEDDDYYQEAGTRW